MPNQSTITKPYIIPLFIPHQGCPHRCAFCDQRPIAAVAAGLPSDVQLRATVEQWLARRKDPRRPVQVAFYGGSFTGLAMAEQRRLLSVVAPYRQQGKVAAIRLSTRPDYISTEIVRFLQEHGVSIVELGVQSMSQEVLDRCQRGHSVKDTQRAFAVLHRHHLQVGAQLMPGLPNETTAGLFAGVRRLIALRPHFVRLYPAVVLAGSGLAGSYLAGGYTPLSLARAIVCCARLRALLADHDIPVIRIGLQDSTALADAVLAGPHHPALGHLVLARQYYCRVRSLLRADGRGTGKGVLEVPAVDRSLFEGPGKRNLRHFRANGLLNGVRIAYRDDRNRLDVRFQGAGAP